MKSKVALLAILIIAVIGGRLWLDPIIRARQIRKIFDAGRSERKIGLPFESACDSITGHHLLFCLEGYAYQEALDRLMARTQTVEEAYRDLTKEWLAKRPALAGVFDEAFGLAIFGAGLDAQVAISSSSWARPVAQKYIVDGWLLGFAVANGIPALLKECDEKMPSEWRTICRFAGGRASFLHSLKAGGKKRRAEINVGYNYSRRFTVNNYKSVAQILALSDPEDRVIQAAKYVASGEPIEDAEFKSINECLLSRHVTECLPP